MPYDKCASFKKLTILAEVGVAADVPSVSIGALLRKMWKLFDSAETLEKAYIIEGRLNCY